VGAQRTRADLHPDKLDAGDDDCLTHERLHECLSRP